MRLSEGFTHTLPSVAILVFYGLSFAAFTMALKDIQLNWAYAVWAGVGVALTTGVAVLYFDEPMNAARAASLALVIAGVAGLHLTGTGEL